MNVDPVRKGDRHLCECGGPALYRTKKERNDRR